MSTTISASASLLNTDIVISCILSWAVEAADHAGYRAQAWATESIESEHADLHGMSMDHQATWRLVTKLKLPWRPLIDVKGSTEYYLNAECTQVALC